MPKINLQDLSNGAVAERIDIELQKVLENIADPNTDPKKPRKLQVVLTFKADDNRDIAALTTQVKSTLVPARPSETKIILDYDERGKVTGAELKSGQKGQLYIDQDGEVADDKGEKIVNFKTSKVK